MIAYGWIYAAAGWGVGVAGVLLLVWALLWDRARGRRRCPKCWYDMAGVPGLKCPECGRCARGERAQLRTRRRWRVAALGVAMVAVGSTIGSSDRIRRHGWPGAVPTWFLAACWPMDGGRWFGLVRMPTGLWHDHLFAEFLFRCEEGDVPWLSARLWAWRLAHQRWDENPGAVVALHDISDLVAQGVGDLREEDKAGDERAVEPSCFHPEPGPSVHEIEERLEYCCSSLIDFDGWTGNGGNRGEMAAVSQLLFVRATPRVQQQIAALFGAIRSARPGEPAPSDPVAWARTRAALERLRGTPVPDLSPSVGVSEALGALTKATGVPCEFHEERFARAFTDPQAPLGLHAQHWSGARLLDEIAAAESRNARTPCAWTVMDGRVIVAAREEIGAYGNLLVHDITPLVGDAIGRERRVKIDDLVVAITQSIAPDAWMDNGGEAAQIWSTSRALIVLAPAEVQLEVERLLDDQLKVVR